MILSAESATQYSPGWSAAEPWDIQPAELSPERAAQTAPPFQGLTLSYSDTQGSRARCAVSSTLGFAAPRFQRYRVLLHLMGISFSENFVESHFRLHPAIPQSPD